MIDLEGLINVLMMRLLRDDEMMMMVMCDVSRDFLNVGIWVPGYIFLCGGEVVTARRAALSVIVSRVIGLDSAQFSC